MGFIDKTLNTIGLTRSKSWIPPLSSPSDGSSSRINNYTSKEEQLKANLGWVYAANDMIAEACAAVEIKLYFKNRRGDREEVTDHELLELLDNPNSLLSGTQLRKLYYSYMNLTGENYIFKQGDNPKKPDALHIFPSHQVNFDVKGELSKSIVTYNQKNYTLEQIIRDTNPDPMNPVRGLGVVAAAAKSIDVDVQSLEYNRRFFANSAKPSMIVEIPNELDDVSWQRLKQQIKEMYTGVKNAHGVMTLDGGATAKPFVITQKEMDYLESRKFTKDEILAMFKVSPAMLGMTENVNRSNAEASEVIFSKQVLVPKVRQFVTSMNNQLVKLYDPKLELDFVNPTPEDKDFKLRTQSSGLNRWLTVNEVRGMDGLEPVESGDMLEPTFSPMMNELSAKVGRMELKSLLDSNKPVEKPKKKHQKGTPYPQSSYTDEVMNAFAGVTNKLLDQFETDFVAATKNHFEEQRDALIDELHGVKQYRNKAKALEIDPEDAKKLESVFIPIYAKTIAEEGSTAMMIVTGGAGFDSRDPAVARFIESRARKISKLVDKETNKALKSTLAEGVRQGESIFELEARINEVFNFNADVRTQRIARTESVRAAGHADIEAWKQSGVVRGKQWHAILDQRVEPFCEEMNGKIVDLENLYFSKGDSLEVTDDKGKTRTLNIDFEDIGSPPIHVGCRCKLRPIIID